MHRITFSYREPDGDRIHYINEDDIAVLLSRLPAETWKTLRAVHFNDHGYKLWQPTTLGYVTKSRRDITICALPPRISLGSYAAWRGMRPEEFGGYRSKFWPRVAIRRWMLYHVFLHELGDLQIIKEKSRSRLKFGRETFAEHFAISSRRRLWAEPFDHPDPAHNPPSEEELQRIIGVGGNKRPFLHIYRA